MSLPVSGWAPEAMERKYSLLSSERFWASVKSASSIPIKLVNRASWRLAPAKPTSRRLASLRLAGLRLAFSSNAPRRLLPLPGFRFLQEPRLLQGQRRLVDEGGQYRDFVVGEAAHLTISHNEHADGPVIGQQRDYTDP